ncbi:MAG: hypothetical protein IK115_08905 [Lachnospiraceae bacterium]|nr:hypothetical protein [Lachnospiraceae bacterium]
MKKKKTGLVEGFMRGEIPLTLFVIYRNEESGKPEFTRSMYLKQSWYADKDMLILGICEDYDTAMAYMAVAAEEALYTDGMAGA